MSHTPGPWTLTDSGGNSSDEELYAIPVYATPIAGFPAQPVLAVVVCADDARLIAAAPELLAACEEFIAAEQVELQGERRRYGLGPLPSTVAAKATIYEAVKKARGA